MTPHVLGWWEAILLGLAAFRVTRLIGWDTITEPWRTRVITSKTRRGSPLRKLIACPWCLGAWVAGAWWVAWQITPAWTLWMAGLWALAAAVGLTSKNLDP